MTDHLCHVCSSPVPSMRTGLVDLCDQHMIEWIDYRRGCIARFEFALDPKRWSELQRGERVEVGSG